MATITQPEEQQIPPQPAPAKANGEIGILEEAGQLTRFGIGTARALPGSLTYFSEGLRQASMMISGTVVLLFFMGMFQGAAIANAGYFVLRGIGAGDFFGLMTGWGVPRFTAQMMFGYVFASKICCGICAQIGAMKIQQEVDALESTGVDRMRYLVGTRLIGTVLFLPVAAVIMYFGVFFGAYFIVVILAQGIEPATLFSVHWSITTVYDLLFMVACMTVIALFCATTACYYGLRTTGGPAAVGNSVARSLVVNLVAIHVVASCAAILMYGDDLNLPIGG